MTQQIKEASNLAGRASADYSGDVRLFCRRCWRKEDHFSAYRAKSRGGYIAWCFLTLGLFFLVGPFRCRCCGEKRYWRIDLLSDNQARQLGASKRPSATESGNHYAPFREGFSLRRSLRRFFRALRQLFFGSSRRRR
jgi:hypothetical protein